MSVSLPPEPAPVPPPAAQKFRAATFPPNHFVRRLATRPRRCAVYKNPELGYHILLIDDDGHFLLAEVTDHDAAHWLADLVNADLGRLHRLLHGEQPT